MNSDLPKVVHVAAGAPMVRWVVASCRAVGAAPIVLVVGHRADDVRAVFSGDDADVRYATQHEQRGTGHAVQHAEEALRAPAHDPAKHAAGGPSNNAAHAPTDVLVLYGDGPLIRADTLRLLVDRHRASGAAATLATSTLDDPTGYGRIVRDARGGFVCIREQKDASAEERAIREVNPGYYCFRIDDLFSALARVGTGNASGEIYLTDVFEILLRDGRGVEVVDAVPPEDVLSVNTPEQLRTVESILLARRDRPHAASARRDAMPEVSA